MTVRPRARLLAWAVGAALVLAACSGSGPPSANGGGASDSGATSTRPEPSPSTTGPGSVTLRWRSCGQRIECTNVEVPLDWSVPAGPKISLRVARKPATDSRRGAVLFNFGGPGVAGASDFDQYVNASFDDAAKTLNQHYDLVSWDPRGTGASDGVQCTTKVEALRDDLDPTPDTPQEVAALTNRTRADTQACVAKEHRVLQHIGTWATVRDLDAIRTALGDQKLTYVGFSYGTELGLSYLATFPTRVRAMVLDGIALPQDPITAGHDQAVGFEQAVRTYLADCKTSGSRCAFGAGNPEAAFTALQARLEGGVRVPASGRCSVLGGALAERKGTVGIGEFDTAVAQAMYDRQLWPILSVGLAQTARKADPDGACLLALRDYYQGIRRDGSLDHLLDAFEAIGCADQPERATKPLGDHPELVTQWSKELPLVGGQFAQGLPGCWDYPPAIHPLTAFTAASFHDTPPVVVVGNTGDPATPFAHAQRAASLLPGSVLVTFQATEHTVFLTHNAACVDQPLVAYLVTTQLPRAGLTCKP